ncbi:putative ribonuclease H-like domain-containing protein [Tanacetum coccineum]
MSLFGQDDDTFTSKMFLNVDQLQKQLDKDDFQEDGSMAAFWVVNRQFQKLIDSQFSLDYDSQMTEKYFAEYTRIEVKQFRDTLLQHMGNVKKSVAKRTHHQRQYDRRVNKRQMQTQESKIDTGKAVDADLVVTESSGTESEVQDDNSRSKDDTNADDADIRPIYDEEPMAEVQLTVECNIFATGQQHTEKPEIINEGQHGLILNETSNKAKIKKEIDAYETINIELEHSVTKLLTENEQLNKENETVKKHYKDVYDSIKIMGSKTIEQTTYLLANNADLKAQIQEKVFAIAALKNELRKLKGNSIDTKYAKTSIVGKPVLQSLRNQSVVRQSNAFKSERHQISKPRFASQVDVKNDLSKPVTQHYLPKRRESAFVKPDQIFTGHRFSLNKTSAVYEKKSLRSYLRWKPTSRIFKILGLRWVPTGKILASCTSKNDSESIHGSNVDIPNIHKCKQTLDLSEGTPINVQKEQGFDLSAGTSNNVKPDNLKACDDGNPSRVNIKQLCGRSYALSWKPCQGDSLNLPDHSPIPAKSDSLPHTHTRALKVNHLAFKSVDPKLPQRAQDDQESQIKMIQDKEMMQDERSQELKVAQEEGVSSRVLPCQLPPKELNLGNLTLPSTIGSFNFYAMADLGASVNVIPKSMFEHLKLARLKKTDMLVEMPDMTKRAPIGIVENVLVKIDKFLFPSDFVVIDMLNNIMKP